MHTLPRRPWTRDDVPVVWRTDDCIEMGWPPREVRIHGVDRSHVAWLLALGGDLDLEQAMQAGHSAGLRSTTMRRLVQAAAACGLLDDAAALPESLRGAPLTLRDRLAGDLATARFMHGSRAHEMMDQRHRAEVAVHGDSALADAVALTLTSAGVGSVIRGEPARSTSRRQRHAATKRACHVLCGACHPDAASDLDAMSLDIPHLAVSAAGTRAVIGPLVIPGSTSCLRCRDLHLADADPSWPRAAVQWSTRRAPPVAAGLAQLAGSWAALQVIALIDAGPVQVMTPTRDGAVVVTLPSAQAIVEPRPAHPLCGCRWPRTGHGVSA